MRMNKAKISSILLAVLLISMSSILTTSVSGQNETVSINFKAHALGHCFVDYGLWGSGSGGGSPWVADWYGIGRGEATFGGFAEAIPTEDPQFEDAYSSVGLKARGTVSFSWVEEDGSIHQIVAHLYSNESTNGLFVPKEDYFLSYPLRFKGIYRVNSMVQKISGEFAWFISIPISPENSPSLRAVRVISIVLLDEATQKGYSAIWSQKETEIMDLQAGISRTLLPAARILRTKVKIMKP